MRIQILIFLCGSGFLFDGDADLYPTFPPDADPDPDPDPSFQINSQTLEMCSNILIFYMYILACHLQIDADSVRDLAYHLHADPDPDFRSSVSLPCGSGS